MVGERERKVFFLQMQAQYYFGRHAGWPVTAIVCPFSRGAISGYQLPPPPPSRHAVAIITDIQRLASELARLMLLVYTSRLQL